MCPGEVEISPFTVYEDYTRTKRMDVTEPVVVMDFQISYRVNRSTLEYMVTEPSLLGKMLW